ncbi:MAG: type II toxin-antitoxin system PemK/MazF family toxin [Patescibacteria group bacterium]
MFKRGKIVLIPFPFSDLSGVKVRPAVIVSDDLSGSDIIVVFISSIITKINKKTDIKILASQNSFKGTGLKTSSVIKVSKIATLDKKIILGEIGEIDKSIEKEINKKLKILFKL